MRFLEWVYAKFFVCSDSVFCQLKVNQNPTSNSVWENTLSWFKGSPQYRIIAVRQQSPRVHDQNGRSITIQKGELSSC